VGCAPRQALLRVQRPSMDDKRVRFEAQVMPHLDAAYRFARWLAGAASDADDLVQEAMLRAFRAFDGLRGTDAKAWLLAIVRNCHFTALQQRRGTVPLAAEHLETAAATDGDPESESLARDEQRLCARLLAALASEHREVLLLREVEDMSYREIATVTQLPIGTVMSRLGRARAALREQFLAEAQGGSRAVR
jgi:RNA polymerase sigma factor (sigma-70 family)